MEDLSQRRIHKEVYTCIALKLSVLKDLIDLIVLSIGKICKLNEIWLVKVGEIRSF